MPGNSALKTSIDFSEVRRSTVLRDERGRSMRYPNRHDYIDLLKREGVIEDEKDFIDRPELNEEVYLDWLRRGQVGCVFAQLFGRRDYRPRLRTVVLCDHNNSEQVNELTQKIDIAVQNAIADPHIESVSVVLPTILSADYLVGLLIALSKMPKWLIEREWPWGRTLVLVGLRVRLGNEVLAEVLGMGPFPFLPPTRQSPITSLEVRTKPAAAKKGKIHPALLAAHLADVPAREFLSKRQYSILRTHFTPWLRRRILGGSPDQRAKAAVTFAVPAALWNGLKSNRRSQP